MFGYGIETRIERLIFSHLLDGKVEPFNTMSENGHF